MANLFAPFSKKKHKNFHGNSSTVTRQDISFQFTENIDKDPKNTAISATMMNSLENAVSFSDYYKKHKDSLIDRSFYQILNELIAEKGMSVADVIRGSGLTKPYVHKIFNGKANKPSRDKLIALGFGLKLNSDELNELLKTAEYRELHPKVMRDAIIIKSLQQGKSVFQTDEELDKYKELTILSEN